MSAPGTGRIMRQALLLPGHAGCRAASLALIAIALAGCSYAGGVRRSARLDAMPDLACIEKTMGGLPGVTDVRYAYNRPLHSNDFTYAAEGVTVLLAVERTDAGDLLYDHAYLRLDQAPPQALVARVRQQMVRVDHAVEENCHIAGLSARIEETCPPTLFGSGKCP